MAVNVKKIALWRKEAEHRPGALAAVFGFANDADAERAARAIRVAAKPAKPVRRR